MNSEHPNNKLLHLEGLRGIAAVIVVFHHYALSFLPALIFGNTDQKHFDNNIELYIASSPLNILFNGGFAVSIFFILSGYVLSNKYHVNGQINSIANSAAKRYFRLMIPVVVSSLLSFILIKAGWYYHVQADAISYSKEWLSSCIRPEGSWREWIISNFFTVFVKYDNLYNPVLWTMTYELLGSLLLFAFLFFQHFLGKKTILYFIPFLILIFLQEYHYASFFAGAILGKLHSEGKLLLMSKFIRVPLFLLGIYLASFPMAHNDFSDNFYACLRFSNFNHYDAYHLLGSFLILTSMSVMPGFKKQISTKPFVFIGKISFSFYLLHFIILASLVSYLMLQFTGPYSYLTSLILSSLSGIALTLLLSTAFYYGVDRYAGRIRILKE